MKSAAMPAVQKRNLERLRRLCLALPETSEKLSWGHPTFFAGKKMFAAFGEEGGRWSIGLNVGFDRQNELSRRRGFFLPKYVTSKGWISAVSDGRVDWKLLAELVETSYRRVALRRMLEEIQS